MTDKPPPTPAWLERALRDPASVFAGPGEAARHPALIPEQRIVVLRSWEYDAAELSVAEEEGMQGSDSDQTPHDDTDQVAPSRQHGLF